MSASKNHIYLIGEDVSRSKSLVIHDAIYNYLGLNFSYKLMSIKTQKEVEKFIDDNSSEALFASNVTYPYKQFVYKLINSRNGKTTLTSQFAAGCNLIITPGPYGYNFDGMGCLKFLESKGFDPDDKNVVICGTGATAKSICAAFVIDNAKKITFVSRSKTIKDMQSKAKALFDQGNIKVCNYDEINVILPETDILLDAAPEPKYHDIWEAGKIDLSKLKKDAIILDVLYIDSQNALKNLADKHKITVYDGKGMLISQAVLCIQEIAHALNCENKVIDNFDRLYNVGAKAIGF